MDIRRAYKFRIYPDIKRQSEIRNTLILFQRLYNKLLERSIQLYKNGKGKISMSKFNEFRKNTYTDTLISILKIDTLKQGSYAHGDSVRPQKEAGIKEIRTYSAIAREAHTL